MEIIIDLDNNIEKPLYVQLYEYLQDAVINNRIIQDEKLPSVRYLAKYLKLSKTTIENAYQQLLAEGYIYSIPQKGYYANNIEAGYIKTKNDKSTIEKNKTLIPLIKYDYKNEYVEKESFDFIVWKKHINHVINHKKDELCQYGNIYGEVGLRREISRYVYRTRGVISSYDNIIIGAGIQSLLSITSVIMKKNGFIDFAIEDPGFNRAKDVYSNNGYNIYPIKISENGIDLKSLYNSKAKICYVSPSYQFPMGTVMTIKERINLIKWANDVNGYIIEDDFNSELRYEGKPIPAMQNLSNERVIYIGSFSTVLIPSLRVSYMILPDILLEEFENEKNSFTQTASKIEQLALESMMKDGDFDRHIRRARKRYSIKNEVIRKTIKKYLGDRVELIENNSGYYILFSFPCKNEKEFINEANSIGIDLNSILNNSINYYGEYKGIFMLSFRGIDIEKIDESIKALAQIVWNKNSIK